MFRCQTRVFLIRDSFTAFSSTNFTMNNVIHIFFRKYTFDKYVRRDIFMSGNILLCFQTVFYIKENSRKIFPKYCL